MKRLALILGVLGFLPCKPCAAEEAASVIRLDQASLEMTPAPEDEAARPVWSFTNTADRPVFFTAMACSCSEVRIEPNPCPAGAKGTVTLVVPLGEQSGRYEPHINLATDLPGSPIVDLILILHLPPAPSLSPTFLRWRVGETPKPQTVAIVMPAESAMTVVRAEASDPRLQATLAAGAKPRTWTLTITPVSTVDAINTRVELLTSDKRRFRVYVRIL